MYNFPYLPEFKQARKFKIRTRIKEQVCEERVSQQRKCHTYESGFNFECDTGEDEDKRNSTINTTTETNEHINKPQQQKKKKTSKVKYCKWCNKHSNHATRQSKSCLHHYKWLQEQKINNTRR